MTQEETRTILTILRTNYPASYKDLDAQSSTMMLRLWAKVFEKVPYRAVLEAVEDIITNDPREFAPNPAQVKQHIKGMALPDVELEAEDAWDLLIKRIREVGCEYLSKEPDYSTLPENIRRIIPKDKIMQLGMNSSEDNTQYEKPQFLKAYKSMRNDQVLQLMDSGNYEKLAGGSKEITHGD